MSELHYSSARRKAYRKGQAAQNARWASLAGPVTVRRIGEEVSAMTCQYCNSTGQVDGKECQICHGQSQAE